MTKPTNPNINFPEAFAVDGQKTDFLSEQIQTGFDPVDPDVLAGDNLNKFIDDTYKGLHYSMDGVNDLYKGAVLYDETETYSNKSIVFNIDENGEAAIYQSLINDNSGNALTDETKWKKVDLGNKIDLDKLNQSKALETGSVSSDADVYADVLKYAHSTFDLSKFTVVGSPNITGDGIASGFGIGNYLKIANLASAPQDSLIVSIEFTPVQNTTDERAQCLFIICSDDPAKRIYLYVQQSGTNVSLDINRTVVTTGAVNINSVNTAKVVWNKVDSTHGKFSLYVNDNLIGTQEFNTSDVIFTNDFNVGFFGSSALTVYYGSIDLKSFSITADGVPVFSGNKTGLDVIKPDNYEVIGTPTITDNGVLIQNGITNRQNHVSLNNEFLNNAQTFTLKLPIKINSIPQEPVYIYNNEGFQINITQYGQITAYLRSGTSDTYWDILANKLIIDADALTSINKDLIVVINFDGAKYKLGYIADNKYTESYVCESSLKLSNNSDINVGFNNITNIACDTEIDLNSVQIWADGNLVCQPCLKIPYTLSKTGSKIVDAAYRDRVQDMYEQYGYAPYYTIDEENQNFTLPMGEIYGMIAQNKIYDGFSLFDTKLTDRILTGDEALGWALQGSLVTMTYPDAVNRIKELYTAGTDTTYRGISCKKTTDGRYIADISQKTAIDTVYSETGIADFYILDSTNNQFYLPRNKYFMQLTDSPTLLNNYNEAGLPNITGNTGKFLTSAKGNTGYWDGAFSSSTSSNDHGAHSYSDERYGVDVNFDAGNSNSIYGNSETVQPPSSNKLLYYKVGHTVINSGSIDVANILSDISSLQEYTGTIDDSIEEAITKTFVPLESIGIAAGTTDLSSYLPADGAIYLVWVEVSTSGKSGTHQTSLSSDVFTVSTSVSMTDADDGRSSNDVSTTCIPVGAERKITKTGDGAAYLKGYCKL